MEGSSEDSTSNSKSGILHHTTASMQTRLQLSPVHDQPENTSVLLAATADCNESVHHVDVSCYVPPESDERTEQLLSMSVCLADSRDPFDRAAQEQMLARLTTPITSYDNYNSIDDVLPNIHKSSFITLGKLALI